MSEALPKESQLVAELPTLPLGDLSGGEGAAVPAAFGTGTNFSAAMHTTTTAAAALDLGSVPLTASHMTVTAEAAQPKKNRYLLLATLLFAMLGYYALQNSHSEESDSDVSVSEEGSAPAVAGHEKASSPALESADSSEQTDAKNEAVHNEPHTEEAATGVPPKVEVPQAPSVALDTSVNTNNLPYGILPNPAVILLPTVAPRLTQTDADVYRARLKHPYVYQHYKAVIELAAKNLGGSEAILSLALKDTQFWTRMRALIALADRGVAIDAQMVGDALVEARPDLQTNFFKRFEHGPVTPGVFHVARAAIGHVAERPRLQLLRVINRETNFERHLYLYAALSDPSPAVRQWANSALALAGIPADDMQRIKGH